MKDVPVEIQRVLARLQTDMQAIVDGDGEPHAAATRIWREAMRNVAESRALMGPLYLQWAALTDRAERDPAEARAALAAMRRAAEEWLSLPGDAGARAAYFDRWLYAELGYDRPRGRSSCEPG